MHEMTLQMIKVNRDGHIAENFLFQIKTGMMLVATIVLFFIIIKKTQLFHVFKPFVLKLYS